MGEWITEYATDFEDIFDGTYCFERECPPGAYGLAQTEIWPFLAVATPYLPVVGTGLVALHDALITAYTGTTDYNFFIR